MESAGVNEAEGLNRCSKVLTRCGEHLVAAFHRTAAGRNNGTAAVLVGLTRPDMGLFADDTVATDFAHPVISVGNYPVPRQQLHRLLAIVADRNGIGKGVLGIVGSRVLGQVVWLDMDNNGEWTIGFDHHAFTKAWVGWHLGQ